MEKANSHKLGDGLYGQETVCTPFWKRKAEGNIWSTDRKGERRPQWLELVRQNNILIV